MNRLIKTFLENSVRKLSEAYGTDKNVIRHIQPYYIKMLIVSHLVRSVPFSDCAGSWSLLYLYILCRQVYAVYKFY